MCLVETCDKKPITRGYCKAHYHRLIRYGDPLGGSTFFDEPKQFLSKLLERNEEGCIFWPFGRNGWGYAYTDIDKKKVAVHRYICEEINGKPSEEKSVARHTCGNGHLGCVNPKHLIWGTQKENQEDRKRHGTFIEGSKVHNSVINEQIAVFIKSEIEKGISCIQIAKNLSVSKYVVYDIKRGRTWRNAC